MAAVVALKDEGAMGAAKGDGRVNAGGYARAFEDDVGTVGGDVADSFSVLDEVIGAEFLRDVQDAQKRWMEANGGSASADQDSE